MSTPHDTLSEHPAPQRQRVSGLELAFAVAGGPVAWFLQFNAGYALASWPCFPGDHRMQLPMDGYAWSFPVMVAAMIAGVIIALTALWVSWRALRKTRDEGPGDHRHLLEAGTGRTRFLALWGVVLGSGFAIASLITGVAFILLPRCAG
jgi:hypothetical protein